MGMTNMALNNKQHAGDEFLAVRFMLKPKKNQAKSEEAGRPIVEDVEYIEIMQPGNKDNIYCQPATDMDKSRFAQHYQMWKARTSDDDPQLIGTPLAEWSGVTRSQAEELQFFNVRTVEQLANMADSNTGNMMGLIGLKEKAKKYLASSADIATITRMTKLEEDNALLQEQVKALMALQVAPPAVSPVHIPEPAPLVAPTLSVPTPAAVAAAATPTPVPHETEPVKPKRKRRSVKPPE